MAKLVDKLTTCVSRLAHCPGVFRRPAEMDPSTPAMCKNCRDDATNTFIAYLNGHVTVQALEGVIVTKGWMMSRLSNMVELFARHMQNVDDDEITTWWQKNAVGPEQMDSQPTHKRFIDMVIRRFGDLQPQRAQGMTSRMTLPAALAKKTEPNSATVPAAVSIGATSKANPGQEPASANPATTEGKKPQSKWHRKSDAKPIEEVKPEGAVVSVEQNTAVPADPSLVRGEEQAAT